MIVPATGKAFAVPFEELARWDVGFFRQVPWEWSSDSLKPLGCVLRSRLKTPVSILSAKKKAQTQARLTL